LLSDYNKLRSHDKRIQEVTDLGLSYNLLTAYTSFVAVDTEVRNMDGRQTTIKQPLPLPQGVSDYAVGSMPLAQAPVSLMARKESVALTEDKVLREQIREKGKKTITLADVTVSEGLSKKEAIINLIRQKVHELEKCSWEKELSGKLVIELVIGSSGQVRTVKIVSSPFKNRRAERCVLEQAQKWQFPFTQDGREGKIIVSLAFRS